MPSITTSAADPRQKAEEAPADEVTALLTSYKPISYVEVRQEVLTFSTVASASLEEWQSEVSMYEQTITRAGETPNVVVPRRNCLTSDGGQVRDAQLFPYHTACFPLLDAYEQRTIVHWDGYREGTELELVLFPDLTMTGNTRDRHRMEMDVSGHLPCSVLAVEISLGISLVDSDDEGILEEEWDNGLEKRLESQKDAQFYLFGQEEEIVHDRFGISVFPPEADARADLLLKILRHALSDLQKDYRLAKAVIHRLQKWRLCQNADCLRRAMSIIGNGLVGCDGHCFERFWAADQRYQVPDHSCIGWKSYEASLSGLFSNGIEYFTSEHALIISSVVLFSFDKLNPGAAELEASLMQETLQPKKQSVEDKQRSLLKRNLFILKNTNYYDETDEEDEEDEISDEAQTDWSDEIVSGLGTHGTYDRKRVLELRDWLVQSAHGGQDLPDADVLVVLLRKSIDSFYNCARCLVSIGEMALRRLPNNARVVGFCSRLVLCLTQMFIEPNPHFMKHDRTYLMAGRAGRSLIDPFRYADCILNATTNYRKRHFPDFATKGIESETLMQAIDEATAYLRTPPAPDVIDLIRCLFANGLVDVSISRCGYGDIHVWWGLPVTPLDSLLFCDSCQCPSDSNMLNGVPWVMDEVGRELWDDRLIARHEFSLVLLLRAWHLPWTVGSHHSFQKPFREAVTTLLLCANRVRMTTDIVTLVSSYLRRDWWPDERSQCWYWECMKKNAAHLLDQKLVQRQVGGDSRPQKVFQFCRECRVAVYCSHGCARGDWRSGHKGMCERPPYRVPGLEEEKLLQEVLALPECPATRFALNEQMRQFLTSCLFQHEIRFGDDDSGSWESMDSGEDEEFEKESETVTDIVFRFFDKLSYRIERAEAAGLTDGAA